jgi:HlyD family secretion protein
MAFAVRMVRTCEHKIAACMKRILTILIPLAGAALGLWLYKGSGPAPETPFVKVERRTLVSLITTNGRVEPGARQAVHAEGGGVVERVHVELGAEVAAGAPLVTLGAGGVGAELAAARARLERARADLAGVERGGPARELAAIDGALAALAVDREAAAREVASLRRLVEQQAATRVELEAAEDRLARLEAERESQEKRRAALVEAGEAEAARARVREAEAALALAERRLGERVLRAPAAGVVYELGIRVGDFVAPGALAARVGRMDPVEVVVYVDEPDLGRVQVGLEVEIGWDARPGQKWKGRVERVPARVAPLGSRQVGEVLVAVENEGRGLPPGANITAEIRAEVVENALAAPKEALQRVGVATGVFVDEGGRLVWRPVRTGVSTVTHVQILEGLTEGEGVALAGARVLAEGEAVAPVYR